MLRKILLTVLLLLLLSPAVRAEPDIENIRFGILREVGDDYAVAVDTTRIPMRLKETGFRFGISFENPACAVVEWFEVVHLPSEMKETSGTLRRAEPRVLKSDTQSSNQAKVTDQFWFDKGDPLGKHQLDLFVNGKLMFSVEFEVIKP